MTLPIRLSLAAIAVATTFTVLPATAGAATTWGCDASAIRGTVLGQPFEPVVANRDAASCQTQTKTLAAVSAPGLPLTLTGPTAATVSREQGGVALGGIGALTIRALPELPIRLPVPELSAALGAVVVPLPAVLGLPASLTLDLRPALGALLPDGRLPNLDLVSADAVTAYAVADCATGSPRVVGGSQVAGLRLLGQDTPVNQVVEQALTLVDTGKVDPSGLDLSRVALPLGLSFADPLLGPILRDAVKPVLDALPDIVIPAALAQVKVSPGEQIVSGDRLTRRALRIEIAIAGQSLVDLVLGEASASKATIDCTAPGPAPTPTDLALACTTRKIVLTDVVRRGDRVRLLGVADRRYAGKRVTIVGEFDGKAVATPLVAPDGSFTASAPLPDKAIRETNAARYRAGVGRERSLGLKLVRRMVVESARAVAGKVTIKGRVLGPLGGRRPIEVRERVGCKRWRLVGSAIPREDGTFTAVIDMPAGASAAVYRLVTKVPKNRSNPKLYPTFTLPRAVASA